MALPEKDAKSVWLLYGLLANREDDHDLRFVCRSEKPQQDADAHRETYEAFMAFPETTADQVEPGGRLVIAPVVADFVLPCRWPNAAELA